MVSKHSNCAQLHLMLYLDSRPHPDPSVSCNRSSTSMGCLLDACTVYCTVCGLYQLPTHSGGPRDIVASDVEPTSVRVSWQAAENADRYNVTLSIMQGKGICHQTSHTVSVVTSDLSVVIGQTAEDMLRPYTTYSVTVGAENDTLENTEYGFPVSFTTKQSSEFLSSRLSLVY